MKKIPAPVQKQTPKRIVTHYIFVIDESGSIGHLAGPLTNQLHAQARGVEAAVKAENAKNPAVVHEATATLITFGYNRTREGTMMVGAEYQNGPYRIFDRQPMERVYGFRSTSSHGTPLFDAAAFAIDTMAAYERALPADADESFVVIAISDGFEGHSRKFNETSLKDLFSQKARTDRWTFAWQLPRNYISDFVNKFGFDRGSVLGWDQTEEGVKSATVATVNSTTDFMASRSAGVKSTRTYYHADAGNLAKAEVKGNLTELPSGSIKALEVDKETDISTFIADHGLPFVAGAGFYLLTKKEKIQHYKELILVPRGEKKYYIGKADARALLGIPATGEIYVEPGNHGDWLIYVQSTSNNRKLVRGTKLLYRTDAKAGAVPQTWDWQKAHKEAQEKQLKIAMDASQPLDNRVFGAIFADKTKAADIQAAVAGAGTRDIDNALKRLKAQGLVEYAVLPNDTKKGWKPVKGAKAPKVQATP